MAFSTLVCVFVAASVLHCDAACPSIRDYGTRRPASTSSASPSKTLGSLIIRGGQGSYCSSIRDCPTAISDLQIIDTKINNLPDIDCSFIIGGDGYVYNGRGWDTPSSAYPDSLVFCVLDNRGVVSPIPTEYQKEALLDLIGCAVSKKKLSSSYTVETPRDRDSSSDDPMKSLQLWVEGLKQHPSNAVTGK